MDVPKFQGHKCKDNCQLKSVVNLIPAKHHIAQGWELKLQRFPKLPGGLHPMEILTSTLTLC